MSTDNKLDVVVVYPEAVGMNPVERVHLYNKIRATLHFSPCNIDATIKRFLNVALVLELTALIAEREGRSPKQVELNAIRAQKRWAKKGVTKSLIQILAEKQQPFSAYLRASDLVGSLRDQIKVAFRHRWPGLLDPSIL